MKRTSKTGFILRLAMVLVGLYMIFQIVNIQTDIREKQEKIQGLEEQVEALRLENQELAGKEESELTDDEIADIAREQLGYAYPNERIFVDITGK